jgi:hypothetical protein
MIEGMSWYFQYVELDAHHVDAVALFEACVHAFYGRVGGPKNFGLVALHQLLNPAGMVEMMMGQENSTKGLADARYGIDDNRSITGIHYPGSIGIVE